MFAIMICFTSAKVYNNYVTGHSIKLNRNYFFVSYLQYVFFILRPELFGQPIQSQRSNK